MIAYESTPDDELFEWLHISVGDKVKHLVLSSIKSSRAGVFSVKAASVKTKYSPEESVAAGDTGYEIATKTIHLQRLSDLKKRPEPVKLRGKELTMRDVYIPENKTEMLFAHREAVTSALAFASRKGEKLVEMEFAELFSRYEKKEKLIVALNILEACGNWFLETPYTSVESIVIFNETKDGPFSEVIGEAKIRLLGLKQTNLARKQ